ncbi:MAG: formylglycine-generating enzyme family protein, partial [Bacteroidales bacterium]
MQRLTIILTFFILTFQIANSQFFYESVGSGTSSTIDGYTGWDNNSPVVYSEFEALYNNDILNNEASDYEGASGGSHVRVGGGGSTFTISGINTTGHPFLILSFGNKCNFPGTNMVEVHVSIDEGNNWELLPVSGIKAYAWEVASANEYLPQDENLHIRWTVNTSEGWMDMRIDDITLTDDIVTDPVIITSIMQLDFARVTIGKHSPEQTYIVEGYNLTEGITIAPPVGFEVSLTSGAGFSSDPLLLSVTGGTLNPQTIYVRFSPVEVISYSGTITHSSSLSNQPAVSVSGEGRSDQPTILVGNIGDFGTQALDSYSAEQWYTIEGYNLTEDISIIPPEGFEVSAGSKTNFKAENPLIIPVSDGNVTPDTVYVRFRPARVETYSGVISHTSGSAFADLEVTGTGSIKQKYRVRIVDYGSDLGRGYYRDNSNTARPGVSVDVDGDGSKSDDCVAYWEFSMDEPMNPSHIYFDEEAPSAVFFGGITAYFDKPGQRIIEGLINENHELRDDFNMMVVQSDNTVNKKAYGLWFWKKEHFLNGGNNPQNSVSFDSNSLIAVHISRYWSGLQGGRFVVRDQGQFYVSEKVFSGLRTSFRVVPTETRWAEYKPEEPYNIRFDEESADWQIITFNHVDAVGFYLFKDVLDNNNVQLKWHSVEVWANVEREPAPGFYTEMAAIPGGSYGGDIDPFYMSKTEIPYHTWQKVYKWAVSNQYCFDIPDSRGYVFDRDGDMGSMDYGNETHKADEPATDMTWLDAVLWCNALSELEGFKPCYYADPGYTQILKQIKDRDNPDEYNNTFPVYVDYAANGYRLPTPTEWAYAATEGTGAASTGASYAWTGGKASTSAVGSLSPNNLGIYDAIGNVWEYTWDMEFAAASFNPLLDTLRTVMGGDFISSDKPGNGRLAYGDRPGSGNFNIGFRVIRADAGATPPAIKQTGGVPVWEFETDLFLENPSGSQPDSLLVEKNLIYLSGSYEFGSKEDDHN